MDTIIDFFKNNWTYIIGISAAVAYIFEKVYSHIKDRDSKKKAYNNVYGAIIRLYYSYIKHKNLYAETPLVAFPPEIFATVVRQIDSFNDDINEFKNVIEKETEIIPEVSLQTHMLFDLTDRLRVLDRINSKMTTENQITDVEYLVVKRAQFSSLNDFFDSFFTDLLNEIRKKTTVRKDFVRRLISINSNEYLEEIITEQNDIMIKYYDSLLRQNAIQKDVYEGLIELIKIK